MKFLSKIQLLYIPHQICAKLFKKKNKKRETELHHPSNFNNIGDLMATSKVKQSTDQDPFFLHDNGSNDRNRILLATKACTKESGKLRYCPIS